MSIPPQKDSDALDLTDQQAAQLDAYAAAHGLTRQQAVTQLARQTLDMRYRFKPKQGQVLPLRRK
ncbi:hypothetical protein [Comamonas jiangduensis]|uniref:hypothetical protein n=1 Tax=Comamonas jiangduensis TaxID=1194168 RepID=UPI0024E09F91|nr:hypothetical protein [Comamonas jiangduensis]